MDAALTSHVAVTGGTQDPARLKAATRQAAEDFESVFLAAMLDGMFDGLEVAPPFGGGHAEQTYRSMLVAEFAGGIARTGGIGIADHVCREILAAQEGANP